MFLFVFMTFFLFCLSLCHIVLIFFGWICFLQAHLAALEQLQLLLLHQDPLSALLLPATQQVTIRAKSIITAYKI